MVNVATASLGGFLADIYTWSDTKRPSIVSTPLATATPADAAPPQEIAILVADDLSPILRRGRDVVSAHSLRV